MGGGPDVTQVCPRNIFLSLAAFAGVGEAAHGLQLQGVGAGLNAYRGVTFC